MKVVIYGATGWLGKSTINHLLNINKDVDLILIASKRKKLLFQNKKFDVLNPDDMKNIKNEEFDILFNYSFLTGNNVSKIKPKEYVAITDEIIENGNIFLENNNVKKALLSSSGAIYWADTKKENIYSSQKLKQERLFIEICENNNIEYSIARIFGLISNFYNVDYKYAFSSFIAQSQKNKIIKIDSNIKVIRSYLVFDRLIDYFLKDPINVFDAWNINLDIYELGKIISKITKSELIVNENYFDSIQKDEYISKDYSFKNEFDDSLLDTEEKIKEIIKFTENKNNTFDIL